MLHFQNAELWIVFTNYLNLVMTKYLLPFFILLFAKFGLYAQNEFITVWKPSNPSVQVTGASSLSTATQAYFPGMGTGYTITWSEVDYPSHTGTLTNVTSLGVGNSPVLLDFGIALNPIQDNATYQVKVSPGTGSFSAILFGMSGDQLKIVDVSQWGTIKWITMNRAFNSCANLDVSATDSPDLSNTTELRYMFIGCSSLIGNSSFNNWNTSNITNMGEMFLDASKFNSPIGNWNTSNVTNMASMFNGASAFNQDIGDWNTSNVTNMNEMFHYAKAFNQPIGNWNTSKVTQMTWMFGYANNFNQPIGNWDISNVEFIFDMFYHARSFNQSLESWNLSKVKPAYPGLVGIFSYSGLSCINYDRILVGWAKNPATANDLNFEGVTALVYSNAAAVAARNTLNAKGWSINGDSYDAGCNNSIIANPGTNQTVNEGTTVTLTATQSTFPVGGTLSYQWNAPTGITLNGMGTATPSFTAPEVSVDTPFTFALTVTDGVLISTASVTIAVKNVITTPIELIADVTATDVKCFGGNDGTATVIVSGGTATYTYLWNDVASQTTATATGLKAGTYKVIVTDALGYTTSAPVIIAEPLPLRTTTSSIAVKCFGANDGTATIIASGGIAPYTYLWNDPAAQTTPTAIGLKSGTYEPMAIDANGCTVTVRVVITEPAPLQATVEISDVSCFGANDGTLMVKNPTGGSGSFEYSLDGYTWISGTNFSNLAPSVYTLQMRDTNATSCLKTIGAFTIAQPEPLQAIVTATSETFAGAKDGAISISSQKGGSGAYEYSIDGIIWTNSSQFTGIASGNYTIMVRDSNVPACQIIFSRIIQSAVTLIADVTHTNTSCYGGNNGSILISNASGAAIIEYSIDGGVTWTRTSNFNGLSAGTYDVMIRDANNSANRISLGKVTNTEPTKLFAVYSNFTLPLCAGQTGSFSISASGGTPPYTGIGDFVMPSGTSRTYIISDRNGCIVQTSVSMLDPPKITATAVINPPNYCNENGTIVIAAAGGTGTLTGVGTFSVQAGKAYSFKVTDSNGCSSNIISGVMPNPDNTKIPMTITESITEIDFGLQRMGAINLQVAGGTESYTYQWSNGAVTKDIHDLKEGGTYSVTVTDSNGCAKSKSITLAFPNYLPIANAGIDQIVYEGVTVTLDGSGSTDANQDKLSYIWTVPSGILLSNSTSSKPSFLAPEVKRDSIITITLVVNDGKANSAPVTVKVAIQNVIKVGIETFGLSPIKIYPNPTTGILRIEGLSSSRRNVIEIFTTDGKVIRRQTSNLELEVIDISHKTPGVYLLVINNQPYKILKE